MRLQLLVISMIRYANRYLLVDARLKHEASRYLFTNTWNRSQLAGPSTTFSDILPLGDPSGTVSSASQTRPFKKTYPNQAQPSRF